MLVRFMEQVVDQYIRHLSAWLTVDVEYRPSQRRIR